MELLENLVNVEFRNFIVLNKGHDLKTFMLDAVLEAS